MLVILKQGSRYFDRPRYMPEKMHDCWVLWDTDKETAVFGPATFGHCQSEQNKREENDNGITTA